MSKRKKLCITAISGNEERWAKKWAESVMKTNPDSVVFNLTAYDDNTESIIKSIIPADKLIFIKHPWDNNFSTARNQGLKHIPLDTDYCFYVDMDEIITEESIPILNNFLEDDKIYLVLVTIYNTLEESGMLASLFYPRLWPHKNKEGKLTNARFEASVHNQLILDDNTIPTVRVPISIMHYGYSLGPEEMEKKHKRSENLLRAQIAENNDSFFSHLNLAQLLRAKGDFIGTEKHANEVLRIVEPKMASGDREKYLHAYIMSKEQLTTAKMALKKFDGVEDLIKDVLDVKPDHLDSILNMGNICLELGKFDKSEFWYKRYLFIRSKYDENKDQTNLILNHLNSSFIALYNLGIGKVYQNDWAAARDYFKQCVTEMPQFKDAFVKYIHCMRVLGEVNKMHEEIGEYMNTNPEKSHLIYEYFGDTELENTNIELAKFNYFQAAFINDKAESNERIKKKYDSIIDTFGKVSSAFFNTEKAQSKMAARII